MRESKSMSPAEMPLLVSYHTPDEYYSSLARKLAASARKLDLDILIESRPAHEHWVENCAQKALFVRDIWHRVDRPICWVDADAEVLRPPVELKGADFDFAVVKRDGWNFAAGQIYFAKTLAAERLIDTWVDYCQAYPAIWDQASLGYAWWDTALSGTIKTRWLDERIFEKASRSALKTLIKRALSRAVFFHAQASRKFAKSSERPEFDSWDIPQWWRDAAKADMPFALTEAQRAELGLTEGFSRAFLSGSEG